MKLEEMLRLALPKKRPEDRFKFYRMLVRDSLCGRNGRWPTEQEIEEEIIKMRSKQHEEIHVFNLRIIFREHLRTFEAENRKKRAQLAAAKRWAKKSEKTS